MKHRKSMECDSAILILPRTADASAAPSLCTEQHTMHLSQSSNFAKPKSGRMSMQLQSRCDDSDCSGLSHQFISTPAALVVFCA